MIINYYRPSTVVMKQNEPLSAASFLPHLLFWRDTILGNTPRYHTSRDECKPDPKTVTRLAISVPQQYVMILIHFVHQIHPAECPSHSLQTRNTVELNWNCRPSSMSNTLCTGFTTKRIFLPNHLKVSKNAFGAKARMLFFGFMILIHCHCIVCWASWSDGLGCQLMRW